jgi:uncharacterized membrane protein YccC
MVQELSGQLTACGGQVEEAARLCDVVCATTSAAGCDRLRRDASQLQQRHAELSEAADEAVGHMSKALAQMTEAELAVEGVQKWLASMEQQLRDVALKASLEEKQQQLTKVKVD